MVLRWPGVLHRLRQHHIGQADRHLSPGLLQLLQPPPSCGQADRLPSPERHRGLGHRSLDGQAPLPIQPQSVRGVCQLQPVQS